MHKQNLSNEVKRKYFISFIITSFAIIGSIILIDKIFAQNMVGAINIQYPVEELGNCKDKPACKSYCDKPENMNICIDFAEKNNLMPEEEIGMAKKFMAVGAKGPGGCQGKDECENYCNNTSHINECIAFAEKNNLIPPEELEEAKKVQAAISRGAKPPPCGNKKTCDVYCDNPDHMEECVNFGIEAGFIQGKELEDVQRMLSAIKRGIKPPPCRGKDACDKYCGDPNNMEVCMTFAIEAGFMSETEKANSQKMLEALKKGVKPPNCRGKEECDIYCSEEEHFEECANFAEAAGFMNPEEAAMARKTKGKGPGDCKGKEECETFCNNPNNQETCFNFGKEHGLIPEKDLKQMEQGKQQFKQSLNQAPPVVLDCFNSLVGADLMNKYKSGAVMPSKEIGGQMRTCFEKGMRQPGGPQQEPGGPGAGGMVPPTGQIGPGSCKNPEECKIYCESHPDECKNFQPGPGAVNPGEQMMPQQAGPGGCKGPDECKAYCGSHPDECKNSGSGGKQQFAPGTGAGPENGKQFAPGADNSNGQPGGQFPPTGPAINCQTPEGCQQQMQNQKQMMPPNTCEGENCQYEPPPAGQQPPTGVLQPQTQIPLEFQQPPINQQPPTNIFAPPPGEIPLPPSSFLNPESLFGLIIYIFTQTFFHP